VHNSKLWCSTSALGQKRTSRQRPLHVCFTSESRHPSERLTCPLCAINGRQFGFEGEYCIASHTAAARKAGITEPRLSPRNVNRSTKRRSAAIRLCGARHRSDKGADLCGDGTFASQHRRLAATAEKNPGVPAHHPLSRRAVSQRWT
jgi:hypothetical protein